MTPDADLKIRRPRGRPRAGDSADRIKAILAASLALFGEAGFGAVSMDAVAARARISKETLYQFFPNKTALFKAVLENQISEWALVEFSVRPSYQRDTLRDSLQQFMILMVRAAQSPAFSVVWRLVQEESFRFPEIAAILKENGSDRGVAACVDLIRHFAERDGIPCRQPEDVARLLTSSVENWIRDNALRRQAFSEGDAQAWIDRTLEIFLAGRTAW